MPGVEINKVEDNYDIMDEVKNGAEVSNVSEQQKPAEVKEKKVKEPTERQVLKKELKTIIAEIIPQRTRCSEIRKRLKEIRVERKK